MNKRMREILAEIEAKTAEAKGLCPAKIRTLLRLMP
jgi:hypothetical protein